MDFKYVSQNVPGTCSNLLDFETKLQSCQCDVECSSDCGCSCLKFGNTYDDDGILLLSHESNIPVTECNSGCSCAIDKCKNRVVQNGIAVQLDVFFADKKGYGLKTLIKLKKGQFVCEYAGEVISLDEAQRRIKLLSDTDSNYIFVLREHICTESKNDIIITCVDPTTKGNLGRFCNHSCDPNLFIVPVRYDSIVPHLALFAKRDIDEGEELCYSYGHSSDNIVTKICLCQAQNCTGNLPYDDLLFE